MTSRLLIKIGGRAFETREGFSGLAEAIRQSRDTEIVIVHGGGAEISNALQAAGRQTRFIDGIRVTQAEDIKIVENVLSGTINERIAAWIGAGGVACQRMSGKTENLLIVEPLTRGGLNWGFVGQIRQVNAGVVLQALKAGRVPVISPISVDANGASYNVNADSAAAALASAARCTDLIFVTDVPGVLVREQIRPALTVAQAQALIADGTIKGGMVAKMEAAFEALANNVPRVHIIQWQGPDTLSDMIAERFSHGTVIQSV
jgi:acetylglutamate kinase